MRNGFVYILTNKNNNVLYVGSTTDLKRRVYEHRTKFYPRSFTAKYNCSKLVYYCPFDSIYDAAAEEKRLKGGSRKQKIDLINRSNSDWTDLWERIQNW